MAKQKFTVWLHKNLEGSYDEGKVWLCESNIAGAKCFENSVSLGSVEVEIEVPEIDTRQAAIDALEKQIQKERADSEVRVNLLLDRISNLRAIGHDGGEA